MDSVREYSQFRIEVRPSPETNDHEVRFMGDGEDIISQFWGDMIGLDPDDILVSPTPIAACDKPSQATVARCNCGVIGCGSVEVRIERIGTKIEWSWGQMDQPQALVFDASSYDDAVERALTDTSWETPDRTAARLLAERIDRDALASLGLTFNWASGRVRKGAFSVALWLVPGPYQILVSRPWNDESPEDIANKCAETLCEFPSNWTGVEWFPQKAMLEAPSLSGPTWKRGTG